MGLLSIITFPKERSYCLTGPSAQEAMARGLANADWYRTPVGRKTLKALMQSRDGARAKGHHDPARAHGRDRGGRYLVLGDVVGGSFMMVRNPVVWRWSHSRHHTDTIIVGRDPENSGMRPPQLIIIGLNVLGLVAVPRSFAALARSALGRLSPDEADSVPESDRPRAFRAARIHMAIYGATFLAFRLPRLSLDRVDSACDACRPAFYSVWLLMVMGLPQQLWLTEDVLDHRLDSRTVLMDPVLRFVYRNMDYHMEHHMHPLVPYHALPALHEAVRHDCPPPSPSLVHAWREIVPCVLRQLRDPHHFLRPTLPPGAAPPHAPPVAKAAD